MLTIVGGAYTEICLDPTWDYLYGSGVRAAAAVSALAARNKRKVLLHSWISARERDDLDIIASTFKFALSASDRPQAIEFQYDHSLGPPRLFPAAKDILAAPAQTISAENALVFGLVETSPTVNAKKLVYDPQAGANAIPLSGTSHKAPHVAIVANRLEAESMLSAVEKKTRRRTVETLAQLLWNCSKADVVVVKNGAEGAVVATVDGHKRVPSYDGDAVFPIGSGDVFSAVFAFFWAELEYDPVQAVTLASAATALYCASRCLPVPVDLERRVQSMSATTLSGRRGRVYLAAPLYTGSQRWLLSECKRCLEEQGVGVFSPMEDVGFITENQDPHHVAAADLAGLARSDVVLAILDGLDAGTVFEIGYARAKRIPVIALAQRVRPLDLTMIIGTGCDVFDDLATAVYNVEGGSKWRRGAAEFGGAGWLKVSEGVVAVAV